MNRFRTKKRAKEAAESAARASTDSDGPSPTTIKPSKTFRLGKKQQQPEPKLELDLSNALPSSDDFRTSLLMSGLSARFSMLREQDDPTSKIGKASDDSVLFAPKRQSRLNDLAFQPHGLSDIAEVSSINGSIRPWAITRTDSYKTVESNGTDEDSVHSGGIMSRAKPGEGNNLFGGRQKIYKIPVGGSGSTKSLGDGSGSGMGGRAIYENDISQSAFQKLREREKEQQQEEQEEEQSARSTSPYYNRNRETSSTTSSTGPSFTRGSTAATSVNSQRTPSLVGSSIPTSPGGPNSGMPGVERPVNKGRRLYETGLDQHLHEQQFSAMNRIDTLTRQRALGAQTPPLGRNSPTALSHPVERWNTNMVTAKASMPNMRTASPSSPTVPGMSPYDYGPKSAVSESKLGFGMPPLSPPMSEHEEHPILAVQPNDRGKATALGAFAKPIQPYDENKYSQRQLQMQQGRETPPPRKHSPPRAFAPRQQMGRTRADSNATYSSARSRSNSSAQRQFLETGSKSKASVSGDSATSSARASSSGDPADQPRPSIHVRDLASLYRRDQEIPFERPPESQHPANRQHPLQESSPGSETNQLIMGEPKSSMDEASAPTVTISSVPADSPTLGPSTEMSGLSGMVRQHLRSDSNTSSVYGGMPQNAFNSHDDEPMPQNEYTVGKHPAASDDWHADDVDIKSSLDLSIKSRKSDDGVPPAHSVRSTTSGEASRDERTSWEKELVTHHTRDGSSETQKEREDFRNDLAARRRKVQENLKSFAETESRSTSPLPGPELLKTNPLGLLKSKTSRGSLMGKPKEFRPLKALNGSSRSSSPARASLAQDPWREEDEQVLVDMPKPAASSPPNKSFLQARREAQRDRERMIALRHQQRAMSGAGGPPDRSNRSVEDLHHQRPRDPSRDRGPPNTRSRHQTPSRERKPPPVTFSQRNGNNRESQGSVETNQSASRPASRQSRERSGSDASQRSKSRNGRYKDDLSKPIDERTVSPTIRQNEFEPLSARHIPRSPHFNGLPANPAPQPSPHPSPAIGSGSEPKNRSRSNSKSTPAGYFDPQKLQTLQTVDVREPALSPRIPLTTTFAGNSTPNLPGPSPVPSTATTPTTPGFQSKGTLPTHRKKSINKYDISEPKFLSTTSRMTTVNLPPGASLQNGIEAPPIPPVNPRRKTRVVFGFGRKDELNDYPAHPSLSPTEDRNTFSDDGEKQKPRQKLRKISSEGGNLNARARQAIFAAAPSPAMPEPSPITAKAPASHVEGGMF